MADLKYPTPVALFKAICDALRTKLGISGSIKSQDIPDKIQSISTGMNTSDATATAADIRKGKTAYGPDGEIIGTMDTVNVPTPSISVSSGGLITAKNTQNAGYTSGGETSNTSQMTTKTGETIRPTTYQKTAVESGRYTTGPVYVEGDSDLVSANIVSGKSIFGVPGTAKTGATATTVVSSTGAIEIQNFGSSLPSRFAAIGISQREEMLTTTIDQSYYYVVTALYFDGTNVIFELTCKNKDVYSTFRSANLSLPNKGSGLLGLDILMISGNVLRITMPSNIKLSELSPAFSTTVIEGIDYNDIAVINFNGTYAVMW